MDQRVENFMADFKKWKMRNLTEIVFDFYINTFKGDEDFNEDWLEEVKATVLAMFDENDEEVM